ncbi:AEC family transporter [Sphingobacterium sp. lm-10]|uniref:AEC family transporter n=1 Tax=Sphingobacterium sp. lm-10 TaxID=2944904 RepID=UPI0020227A92|nr:AEC family transporter [Sphingobacterium sp. lm-10]MCL7988607.1 AEC family transporter [Sphingobacterium sp. lm-10]
MDIINELATRVLPLYGFILIGWFAHVKWNLKSKWISKVLLFALIPILIIENLLKADLAETAVSGSIIFILALAMNIPAIIAKRSFANDYDGSLLKGSFSYYNIGWFGIPIVMALFGEEQMPLIISAYVGNALYGDTIGFYLMSRTKDVPTKEAVKKVFQIPAVYACIVAIGLNLLSVELPESVEPVGKVVSWIVSALGMLIIGVTMGDIDFKKVAYKTFSKILGLRYVAGAIILGLLVFAESQWFSILDEDQSMLMLLMASFPIAANLVVFASFLETEEENAALLVGISSILSLILVPILSVLLF